MPPINSTKSFHINTPVDLLKEYTIAESLSGTSSPYMTALEKPESYGKNLGTFLSSIGLVKEDLIIAEVGGGYGSLMKAFLSSYSSLIKKLVMIDLSKGLLKKQKEVLASWAEKISFVNADIMEVVKSIKNIDLLIANEVIGDLETMTGLRVDSMPEELLALIERYGLEIPNDREFSLNTGAIKLVEAICLNKVSAFISEHSCDPIIPEDMPYLAEGLALNSWPREIKLFKHSEYTIRFSHLIKVARALGRKTLTGSLAELVGIKKTPDMKFIFTAGACSTPYQEIILELLDHIREYRWLVIY